MNTEQGLLRLPAMFESDDLAFFLRTTGPTAPHRRPSKVSQNARTAAVSRHAFHFLKRRRRRPQKDVEMQDAGGLLVPVEQKVSAGGLSYVFTPLSNISHQWLGNTYFALKVPSTEQEPVPAPTEMALMLRLVLGHTVANPFTDI